MLKEKDIKELRKKLWMGALGNKSGEQDLTSNGATYSDK